MKYINKFFDGSFLTTHTKGEHCFHSCFYFQHYRINYRYYVLNLFQTLCNVSYTLKYIWMRLFWISGLRYIGKYLSLSLQILFKIKIFATNFRLLMGSDIFSGCVCQRPHLHSTPRKQWQYWDYQTTIKAPSYILVMKADKCKGQYFQILTFTRYRFPEFQWMASSKQ